MHNVVLLMIKDFLLPYSGKYCLVFIVFHQIHDVLESYHKDLTAENMANMSSVLAYISAVRAARQADKKTLSKIFKDKANKDIR